MTAAIKQPSAAVAQQPRLLELHAGFRDPALHRVILDDRAAEGAALRRAHHHQFEQQFAEPDRAYAVMDACRPEPDLRDLEPLAFGAEQVFTGHTYLVESQFADRRDMILATHEAQPSYQAHARRIHRHDDAGMAAGALGF